MTSTNETAFDPTTEVLLAERVGTYLRASEDGRGVRVGLACGRFNGGVTTRLLDAALEALLAYPVFGPIHIAGGMCGLHRWNY